uniref:Galectin n=1 Tax=Urocitellus parryii TaxID=9999 RepID=A0A8D2GYY1_UROPR
GALNPASQAALNQVRQPKGKIQSPWWGAPPCLRVPVGRGAFLVSTCPVPQASRWPGQRTQGGKDPTATPSRPRKPPVPNPAGGSCVPQGLVASNLNLKPGECLRVRGEVAPDAKSFVLNLGKDSNNLCLHFNPRFNAFGDANTIVCNSKDGGAWGAEHREPAFPFQPGSVVEVCFSFDQTDLTIKLPDGHEFKFPNRLNLEAINYVAADGDFKIKCIAFE